MSRGLGKLQRRCLTVLQEYKRLGPLDSLTITRLASGKIEVTESQWRSVRRALCGLAKATLIENAEQRAGCRLWRLPQTGGHDPNRFGA
ncbi:MAG: hypothetical protein ABSH20_04200 [Tepidisphaeraceae bacterium]|jgi:hypothetical protein